MDLEQTRNCFFSS